MMAAPTAAAPDRFVLRRLRAELGDSYFLLAEERLHPPGGRPPDPETLREVLDLNDPLNPRHASIPRAGARRVSVTIVDQPPIRSANPFQKRTFDPETNLLPEAYSVDSV